MARQFSPTQFFRRVPNALLARYFQDRHGVLKEIEFDQLNETEIAPVFRAFTAIADEKQATIEAECQDIDLMACQGGITALADESAFHLDVEFTESIAAVDGFHGKAMWAFLEHPDYWAGATLFLHSDNIAESSWKRRNDLPHVAPHVEPDAVDALARAISEFFLRSEGRGRNCKVEVFRRHDKEYFFAYPEDYAQSGVEWVRNSLDTRARHPAFEIIFVYCQASGSLDVYAPRNTKYITDLQHLFAETILKLEELEKDAREKAVYELDKLASRDFVFQIRLGDGIESVMIRSLRLSPIGRKRKITLVADPTNNPHDIYDLMDELRLAPFHVTQAEIMVTFAPTPSKRSWTRTFKISYPSWCALRHEGDDLIIRQMLAASGIEPMTVTSAPDVSST